MSLRSNYIIMLRRIFYIIKYSEKEYLYNIIKISIKN